jgi:hypothetical protein
MPSEIDLLDIKEVYEVPGVMQLGDTLPKPYFDFRKIAPKGTCRTSHLYWLRRDIEKWVAEEKLKLRTKEFTDG